MANNKHVEITVKVPVRVIRDLSHMMVDDILMSEYDFEAIDNSGVNIEAMEKTLIKNFDWGKHLNCAINDYLDEDSENISSALCSDQDVELTEVLAGYLDKLDIAQERCNDDYVKNVVENTTDQYKESEIQKCLDRLKELGYNTTFVISERDGIV